MSIIKKELNNPCYVCNGTGKIKRKKCSVCFGTGVWKDFVNYYIDDKKKICLGGENGQ